MVKCRIPLSQVWCFLYAVLLVTVGLDVGRLAVRLWYILRAVDLVPYWKVGIRLYLMPVFRIWCWFGEEDKSSVQIFCLEFSQFLINYHKQINTVSSMSQEESKVINYIYLENNYFSRVHPNCCITYISVLLLSTERDICLIRFQIDKRWTLGYTIIHKTSRVQSHLLHVNYKTSSNGTEHKTPGHTYMSVWL